MKEYIKYSDSDQDMELDMDFDFSEIEKELEELSVQMDPEYEEIITKRINKEIRKRLRKAGIIAAVIAIAVTLFTVFALPKLVDMMYYNPARVLYADGDWDVCQLEQDINTYAEAVLPEWGPGLKAAAASKGWGNYTFYIQRDFNTNNHDKLRYNDAYAGEISRGNGIWYDPSVLDPASRDNQRAFSGKSEELNQLADNTDYYAYISFNEDMSYEELLSWFNENRDEYKLDNSFVWCAVRNSDNDAQNYNYGFRMYSGEVGSECLPEDEAETHYLELMNYIGENEDFAWIMDAPSDTESYKKAASYVENNGLRIYGIMLATEKNEIVKLSHRGEIGSIITSAI